MTFSRERNPSIRDDHVAEAVIFTKGPNLVAREAATTYEAAVDQLVDKLERQIERYRDKRVHEPRRAAQRKREQPTGLGRRRGRVARCRCDPAREWLAAGITGLAATARVGRRRDVHGEGGPATTCVFVALSDGTFVARVRRSDATRPPFAAALR